MRFAIPTAEGKLTPHFGHCREFAIIEVENNEIQEKKMLTPPPHEPGVLPAWLHQMGTQVVIAGGMGQRAVGLLSEQGIQVITGAPALDPEDLVRQYLEQSLTTGANLCDH